MADVEEEPSPRRNAPPPLPPSMRPGPSTAGHQQAGRSADIRSNGLIGTAVLVALCAIGILGVVFWLVTDSGTTVRENAGSDSGDSDRLTLPEQMDEIQLIAKVVTVPSTLRRGEPFVLSLGGGRFDPGEWAWTFTPELLDHDTGDPIAAATGTELSEVRLLVPEGVDDVAVAVRRVGHSDETGEELTLDLTVAPDSIGFTEVTIDVDGDPRLMTSLIGTFLPATINFAVADDDLPSGITWSWFLAGGEHSTQDQSADLAVDFSTPGTKNIEVRGEQQGREFVGSATVTIEAAFGSGPPPSYAVEVPSCAGFAITVLGTAGDDDLQGTPDRDVISGLGGNDTIAGLGGDDIICGGPGDDRISAGAGDDVVYAGGGNDWIELGGGRDTARGGGGDDQISGGRGRDVILGSLGDDVLNGGAGADLLDGGAGRDRFGADSDDSCADIQGAQSIRVDC